MLGVYTSERARNGTNGLSARKLRRTKSVRHHNLALDNEIDHRSCFLSVALPGSTRGLNGTRLIKDATISEEGGAIRRIMCTLVLSYALGNKGILKALGCTSGQIITAVV